MVQASQFYRKAHEDASAHLRHCLEICSTFTLKDVPRNAILLCLFPLSLLGKAKQWFYANKEKNTMWALCSTNFLAKFFPLARPMLFVRRYRAFSNNMMRQSQKLWSTFKIPYLSVLIMGWRIGFSCRHFIMGSATALLKPWILWLEEHSCHLLSLKPLLLWKRWLPIKVGVKK